MRRKKVIIVIVIVGLVLLAAGAFVAVYLVRHNTSFLGGDVPEDELARNNTNIEVDANAGVAFIELEEKKLVVPNQFAEGAFSQSRYLHIPDEFSIAVYVAGLDGPRFFDFDESGNMYVAEKGGGRVTLVTDADGNGVADSTIVIDDGLVNPHGIDWHEGDLYVGETDTIRVYKDITAEGDFSENNVLVDGLPTGGHHTRTVVIGPDEKIYVSIGSSCNVCVEDDTRRAAIIRYDFDGTGEEIFAEGLRNTVDFEFRFDRDANDYTIWSVDNGRDLIGDELPPEEVNRIRQGAHYGWPYCYGDGIANPEFDDRDNFCRDETVYPEYNMQAHSAPLGLSFIPRTVIETGNFPAQLVDDLFIGFHGSWNRSIPTGYKIVRINTSDPNAETIDFITGWLEKSGNAWGRPVDVGFDDETMYISDDKAGAVYRVVYTPER